MKAPGYSDGRTIMDLVDAWHEAYCRMACRHWDPDWTWPQGEVGPDYDPLERFNAAMRDGVARARAELEEAVEQRGWIEDPIRYKQQFEGELRERAGLRFVGLALGRRADGALYWSVTALRDNRILETTVDFPAGVTSRFDRRLLGRIVAALEGK